MPKYRKRPLVVEAVRVTSKLLNRFITPPEWLADFLARTDGVGSIQRVRGEPALHADFDLVTPHGPIRCGFGDWVVLDQFGHLHPYTDEHFRLIFEEVE